MSLSIEETYNVLQQHDNWIVMGHYGADGDCIGSILSVYGLLKALGKNVIAYHPEKIHGSKSRFSHLPLKYASRWIEPEQVEAQDWKLCAVDCAARDRVCPKSLRQSTPSRLFGDKQIELQIDHHISNTFFAKNNLVQQASSTTEILHELLIFVEKQGFNIPKKLQAGTYDAMWVGMVTDTGSFGYSNTTANTHMIAADLIERGVNPAFWRNQLFGRNNLSQLKLEAKMLENSQGFFNNKLLLSVIDKNMLETMGVKVAEGQDGSDKLRDIEQVEIAITIRFLGENKSWKVSSRTNNAEIDLSTLASSYQGGGHAGAAGWLWKGEPEDLIKKLQTDCKKLYPQYFN